MNREIKFRAFDKIDKEMFRVIMLTAPQGKDYLIVSGRGGSTTTKKDACVLMQYTGLKASDEVTDVYEGDILNVTGLVVGNKYESPQILEEGDNCLIEGMGTRAWRGAESIAMGRGCVYAQ